MSDTLTADRRAAMLALFEAQRTRGRGPAVWIAVSGGDAPYYHRRPGCYGGTYIMYSTERAVAVGYAPCRRCWGRIIELRGPSRRTGG